jgi:hypothetical protein
MSPPGSLTAVSVSGATPSNAPHPMEVTLEGMVTDVKPEHL